MLQNGCLGPIHDYFVTIFTHCKFGEKAGRERRVVRDVVEHGTEGAYSVSELPVDTETGEKDGLDRDESRTTYRFVPSSMRAKNTLRSTILFG